MLTFLNVVASNSLEGRSMSTRRCSRAYRLQGVSVPKELIAFPLGLVLLGVAGCTDPAQDAPAVDVGSAPASTGAPATEASERSASRAPELISIEGEVLLGNPDGATDETVEGRAPNRVPSSDVTALAALEGLEVKPAASEDGFGREEFGERWLDVDGNGCDTRNDMLNRDLSEVQDKPGTNSCMVASGILRDPYTNTTIDFLAGPDTSDAVQIDHVVALGDAWRKGAQKLSRETRILFANDPFNLQATDGPTNEDKGEADAAAWLPPNESFRCEYIALQIAVKTKYDLWVTQPEKDAMVGVLSTCEDETLPVDVETWVEGSEDADVPKRLPAPAPKKAPDPVVEEVPAAENAFANCSEAADLGVYNIPVGDSRYGPHLDPDMDGVACENAGVPYVPAPAVPAEPVPPAVPAAPYARCAEVYAEGKSHITAADPRWQPGLDRNGDGVGCEGS